MMSFRLSASGGGDGLVCLFVMSVESGERRD